MSKLSIRILIGMFVFSSFPAFCQECTCGHPCNVFLEYQYIFGVMEQKACLSVKAGPDLHIYEFADVTLSAGESISLSNNFSVSDGAILVLKIDPELFCDLTLDGDNDSFHACVDCDDDDIATYPGATEICDGKDNDCNGASDDGNPGGGASCDTGLFGACAGGTETCTGGLLQCVQNLQSTSEICNNIDDDCNGIVDEGNPGGGATCDTGLLGACAVGTETCTSGSLQCVPNLQPVVETCNHIDDDCDGVVDNGPFTDWAEPNENCISARHLGTIARDQIQTHYPTIFNTGDNDFFRIRAEDLEISCAYCDWLCLEREYQLEVTLSVPAGAGSFSLCAADDCNLQSNCVEVQAGASATKYLRVNGTCIQPNLYDFYFRVYGGSAPAADCEPYTLSYSFSYF